MVNQCNALSTYIGQPNAPTATAPAPTTTVVAPPAPTTTVVQPQPTAPAGPTVPKYGQCGGNGVRPIRWFHSNDCADFHLLVDWFDNVRCRKYLPEVERLVLAVRLKSQLDLVFSSFL